MTFSYSFYNEHQLLLLRVCGEVSLAESHEISERLQETLEATHGTPTDIFIDVREVTRFPKSLSDLKKINVRFPPDQFGYFIVLMEHNPVLSYLVIAVIRNLMNTMNVRIFLSLEEALTFLHSTQDNTQVRRNWLSDLRQSLDSRPKNFSP